MSLDAVNGDGLEGCTLDKKKIGGSRTVESCFRHEECVKVPSILFLFSGSSAAEDVSSSLSALTMSLSYLIISLQDKGGGKGQRNDLSPSAYGCKRTQHEGVAVTTTDPYRGAEMQTARRTSEG